MNVSLLYILPDNCLRNVPSVNGVGGREMKSGIPVIAILIVDKIPEFHVN